MNQSHLVHKQLGLSIRLRSGGFSLILNSPDNEAIMHESHLFERVDTLDILQRVKMRFPTLNPIEIFIESNYYTLIPRHLFKIENSKDYMRMQHPNLLEDAVIYFMQINVEDAVLLFSVDTDKLSPFQQVFPNAIVQHHLFKQITSTKAIANDIVSVLIRDKAMDIVVFQHAKLKLINSFIYQTEEDIIYHIMNVFQLLNLNYDDCHLELTRTQSADYHPEDFLKKYISKIHCSTQI